jgi:hypothetical protein
MLPGRTSAHAEQLARTPRLAHTPPFPLFTSLPLAISARKPARALRLRRQGKGGGNNLAPRCPLAPLTHAHPKTQQPSPNWPIRQLGIFSPLLLLRRRVKGRRERGGEGGRRNKGRRVSTASSCRSGSTRSRSQTSREEGRPRACRNRSRGSRAPSSSPRRCRREHHHRRLHGHVYISAPR